MDKITVAVSCPIDTYSGYGARARDFVKALLHTQKYDVKILSQRWGSTRFGYLKDHNESELASLIIPGLTTQPDVWVQVTIPNEFQPVGKYNIGLTAGIETTICDPSWIEGINRMNMILVSSEHAKKVFETSQFQIEQAGQHVGSLKVEKPIEVLFEGADLTKYFPTKSTFDLSTVKEDFAYLVVGHWLQGEFGQDRKNIGYTVKLFLEVFKNKKDAPALILKTQSANASRLDQAQILGKIDAIRKTVKGTLPNIYIIHGEMSDEEINHLYNHPKVKAMISLTKGEGFGRPLLEFSLINKPIIASGWSGQVDFLKKDFCYMVNGNLTNVHPSAVVEKMILKEAQWFTPEDSDAATGLKVVHTNYKKYTELAKRQGFASRNNFSWEKMAELLDEILSKNLPEFPKEVALKLPTLQLPKLQKVEEMPKLNLPKLQKI
jgi:glycosyltransferase involved in cell wall biosynthesis